ncbi:hypothetical protein V6Z79_000768 [Aspergillus fumigatus]
MNWSPAHLDREPEYKLNWFSSCPAPDASRLHIIKTALSVLSASPKTTMPSESSFHNAGIDIVIIPDTSGSESASLYPTAELQRDFLLLELYALAVWTARYVLKNSFS